jgi:hypothetical protein
MDTAAYLRQQRLTQHQLLGHHGGAPDGRLAWMGALQAQELAHAKAALGLRLSPAPESAVEIALAKGEIVHTWAMRGTLHLVAAADVWWLQPLVGKAVMASAAGTLRKGGLDEATLHKAYDILGRHLPGKGPILRTELIALLAGSGIDMKGPVSSRIFTAAAYQGLVCLGPMMGKQETFVWLRDWVPPTPWRERLDAVVDLAGRYFQSHGPATLEDFVAWSGLGLREARAGLQECRNMEVITHEEAQYFWMPMDSPPSQDPPSAILLPGFDEYILGYRNRALALPPQYAHHAILSNGIFRPTIVIDGMARGIWKRNILRAQSQLELQWFTPPKATEIDALQQHFPHWQNFWETEIEAHHTTL